MNSDLIEGYAHGKLYELVFALFTDFAPAREKLSNCIHIVFIISPSDFKLRKHQVAWANCQEKLRGKTKNIGLQRAPIERLTIRNKTLRCALETIWGVFDECVVRN